MKWRYLTHEDYDTLTVWWKQNRFPAPPRDFLPNNGLDGIMVIKDGVEMCAGFIYETSCTNLAWIEFIVANFDVKDRELRRESQNYLINVINVICKNMGKKYMFTSVKNKGLIDRYKECGYIIGSNGTTEMVKAL